MDSAESSSTAQVTSISVDAGFGVSRGRDTTTSGGAEIVIPDSAVKHRPNAALGYCSFGPFRFFLLQRVLVRAGTPLRIGSRAREILLALVERAGEVVSKRELISRVWPHTIIEEVTLRAHIAALRKVLGDAEAGMPYVQNVTGFGYRFAAPVVHAEDALAAAVVTGTAPFTLSEHDGTDRPTLPGELRRSFCRT
jgi:DNA-binding winged helix-turn-helix (wHTH) protein